MVVFFVDLKAVFDSMDRRVLIQTMKKKGERESLLERIVEALWETKNKS